MARKLDLTGQKYGRLTVICKVPKPENLKLKSTYWLCRCECGNEIILPANQLTSGRTKSCGCYRRDRNLERLKKYNKYDLTGEYGICYSSNTDDEILFDFEDYDKIKDFCWRVTYITKENQKYKRVRSSTFNCDKKIISMHRYILGVNDPSIIIDHKNRNPLDNRKANLRICNSLQNSYNSNPKTKGFKGVTMYKNVDGTEKWVAQIQANYNKYVLGTFNTKEEAALAYNEAAKVLHGEFAYLNEVHMENEINTNKGEINYG